MTPDELADKLDHAATRIGPAVARAVQHTGTLGQARIRGNASGRPGPNIITGAYRNSWQADTRRIPYGAICTLGTRAPQGRRLEFGFTGIDSLGRHYNQPPFPHVQPALPFIEQALRSSMRLAVAEILL
ncbi:HK97 gp10 family phage protein [Streptomyces scabiei]|uniref:HK97 gp10 family phage protein n=1 Tax=Streptomyces scabiei TaxID=1930 RepID=UPI0007658F91|nr:HK97 gp10 family phage protein [Streptomyces scabiei]MDX2999140.1 HK97 gp10 family phage protein [Streptomyces scabiei]MDX3048709.1 HK97 gp10 family phage protein [Streptomyces scabiei]MDX3175198.1 HK97 gp10 family phage protein [Streptomyces scabiei]